jgi:hypothetical protein
MEFGIGFVAGGLLGGIAVAKSGGLVKVAHQWMATADTYLREKITAKVKAFKAKL